MRGNRQLGLAWSSCIHREPCLCRTYGILALSSQKYRARGRRSRDFMERKTSSKPYPSNETGLDGNKASSVTPCSGFSVSPFWWCCPSTSAGIKAGGLSNSKVQSAMIIIRVKGNWNILKGRLKQKCGRLRNDEVIRTNGTTDEIVWRVHKRTGQS